MYRSNHQEGLPLVNGDHPQNKSSCAMTWPVELDNPDARFQDRRNVIDHYKYWHVDAIRADLDERRHPFAVVVENLAHDFNIGTVIRNANAFLASHVWIAGLPHMG